MKKRLIAAEKNTVEPLRAENAEVEAAAAKELVAGGEKYMKEIATTFMELPAD